MNMNYTYYISIRYVLHLLFLLSLEIVSRVVGVTLRKRVKVKILTHILIFRKKKIPVNESVNFLA
jgi:hypothetical protein